MIELSSAYERYLAGVKTRNFSLSYPSGNDICQQPESSYDIKHQEFP